MSESQHLEEYTITAESTNPTQTAVSVRDFEFVVDEPADVGGTDEGPTPVEYLIGAWAGCLNVVGHLVAKEHGIAIDNLEIEISGKLNPGKFTGKTPDVRAGYQNIEATLHVETDADQATLEEWITEVEERCPVSDNLQNATPTDITVTAQ